LTAERQENEDGNEDGIKAVTGVRKSALCSEKNYSEDSDKRISPLTILTSLMNFVGESNHLSFM
jgi:hypothetical protein